MSDYDTLGKPISHKSSCKLEEYGFKASFYMTTSDQITFFFFLHFVTKSILSNDAE